MPGENSGGGADAGYTPPKPKSNPGGKVQRKPKRNQTVAPKRKPQIGATSGGSGGQKLGNSKPKAKSSGGGSGMAGGGGGGGGYITSNASGVMAAPVAPSMGDFLGQDDVYQQQVAALTKAMANYRSQMGERTDEYQTDFTRRMGDLNLSEERGQEDQQNDYTGRGMLFSGLYGKARGDLEQDFNNREGDMNLGRNQFLAGLNRDFTNFGEENNLSKQRAQQDAAQRRSLQYGL